VTDLSTAAGAAAAGAHEADEADEADEAQQAPVPERRHGAAVTWSHGQEVLHVSRDGYVELIGALLGEGFVLCADLCAVDYSERPLRILPEDTVPERFEVVVNLLCMEPPGRVRIRVQVPENEPTIPTLFALYPGTEAMEREAFDLFGIVFSGHPDLTRILMPEDWEGHPLRKDYAIGRVPVQFKAAPSTQ
jgi:NADH-quinone oxidoreductase subunit C